MTRHWCSVLSGAVLLLVTVAPAPSMAAVLNAPPTNPCPVGATAEADGHMWSCVETNGVPAWVDLGHTKPPLVSCTVGSEYRFNGYAWTCELKPGSPVLVKTKPWRQPATLTYSHTSKPSRSSLTISANVPLAGCRLAASDPRLLRDAHQSLTGRTARRTLDTAGLTAGVYKVTLACRDWRLNQTSDLLVRRDGSVVLRSDCLDAWHDDKYADIVPGYGRRLTPAAAAGTRSECRRLASPTLAEMNRVSAEMYDKVALIAEREVRRVSTLKGIPICQAIDEVFRPVDALGRRTTMSPIGPGNGAPIAGYPTDSFFPVLNHQWTDGPFRLKNTAGCGSGNQALRLYNTTWIGCPGLGNYGNLDLYEMYPAFDSSKCPSSVPDGARPDASVCIVWGDQIGNDIVGGVGKVFSAQGALPNDALDCQDRFLHRGIYLSVTDPVLTALA
jgi:hypothetical protein